MTDLRPAPDEDTVLLEQELFAQRRLRDRLARRRSRRRPVLLVLGVVLALGAAGYAVGFSPLLAADRVEVTGTRDLAPVVVREAAQVPRGRPLARVDLGAISARVAALPAVASVRVSRAWPRAVRIAVTERVAVAVVDRGDGFRALSADGVLFRQYPDRPKDLPLIQDEVGAGRDALREAAEVASSLPPGVLAKVNHLSVRSVDRITLTLRSGRVIVWGNASDSATKADVVAVLIKRKVRLIDVSVPGRPVTR